MVSSTVFSASLFVLATLAAGAPHLEPRAQAIPIKDPLPSYISENLGIHASYKAQGEYQAAPSGCTISQVNILQRHGSRFPDEDSTDKITKSLKNFKDAMSLSDDLAFVKDYKYNLGVDDLVPQGEIELQNAGREAYNRYSALYPAFTRTDEEQRVQDSATNWLKGYYLTRRVREPPAPVVMPASKGSQTTLDILCDGKPDLSEYQDTWRLMFMSDAIRRFNYAAPGALLEQKDLVRFMQLCGYDAQYSGTVNKFCNLFTEQEWKDFAYYYDVKSYYDDAYGNPLGAATGVGYVAELLARLTGDISWVENDATSVPKDLDLDSTTFPLDSKMYVDFTHNGNIAAALTTIGLKKGPALPANERPEGQEWFSSKIIPFGARLVTEKLTCSGGDYVRFFLNDELLNPSFCSGADASTGLCSLDNFVASQTYVKANGKGEYAQCSE
ncbi:hypothetical protein JCM6882_006387 [Rhodosporidiobolus microsporus]